MNKWFIATFSVVVLLTVHASASEYRNYQVNYNGHAENLDPYGQDISGEPISFQLSYSNPTTIPAEVINYTWTDPKTEQYTLRANSGLVSYTGAESCKGCGNRAVWQGDTTGTLTPVSGSPVNVTIHLYVRTIPDMRFATITYYTSYHEPGAQFPQVIALFDRRIQIIVPALQTPTPIDSTEEKSNADFIKSGAEQSEIVSKYLNFWERLFKEKNHLSDAEFDQYISYNIDAGQKRVFTHNQGNYGNYYSDFLTIEYFVAFDWFRSLKVDQLSIMMSSADKTYKNLNISRDVYLSEGEIRRLLAWQDRFPSKNGSGMVSLVNLKKPLLFATKKDAVNKFSMDLAKKFTKETPGPFSEETLNTFQARKLSEGIFEDKFCGINADPCLIVRWGTESCIDRDNMLSIAASSINLVTGETKFGYGGC